MTRLILIDYNKLMARLTKQDVEQKITDWFDRLEGLYKQIDAWLEGLSDYSVERSHTFQRTEELMKKFAIKPKDVPTYKIKTKRGTISFFPTALWVIGADSKVDIHIDTTKEKKHLMLFDMRNGNGDESNWQVSGDDLKKLLLHFDKKVFTIIIKDIQ
ncbi:MAG: hypothetical protein SFH39_14815 [Candidatus Magnetobacterium sp. LHC-1]|nr:hypothetical protein [Nitrospirota bacterium]